MDLKFNQLLIQLTSINKNTDDRFMQTTDHIRRVDKGARIRIDQLVSDYFDFPELTKDKVKFKDYLVGNLKHLDKFQTDLANRVDNDFLPKESFNLFQASQLEDNSKFRENIEQIFQEE